MTDLCILASVKEWLRTGADPIPTTDDAMLARLITAASAFVETWLSRPIGLANWQEVRDGMGGERANRMVLAVTPVVAVQSLTIDRIAIQPVPPLQPASPPGQPVTFSSTAGYLFTPTELVLRGFRFERGTANVVVQYTAGYYPIPADLEQATIELVSLRYKERRRIGEVSRSLGGAETVAYSQKDMTDAIKTQLSRYRQVATLSRATLLPSSPADDPMLVGVIV
jgi:hypothetical protein